ncbi:MAG: orotate phosphoribosyltransferase [Bernardetiaceae bacterium]
MQMTASNLTRQAVARRLLALEAVKFSPDAPFRWASGWLSPIYCDNRLTLSDPETRRYIKMALSEAIFTEFPEAGGIAGVATAGLPQAALVADTLNLPMIYVRDKAKAHGRKNQIEGKLDTRRPWVVIEDLISTAGSSLAAVSALRAAGAQVVGIAAIFTYGFGVAEQNLKEAQVPWVALSDYTTLIKEALQQGYVSQEHAQTLQDWRKDPENWHPA